LLESDGAVAGFMPHTLGQSPIGVENQTMDKVRLDKIIAVKEKILEDKHKEIEQIEQVLVRIAAEIAGTDKDILKNYEQIGSRCLEGSDFSVLKNYIAFLEGRRVELLKAQKEAELERERIRLELVEMLKEVRILGRLKEKVLRAFRKSLNREQQKQLDEMALRIQDKS
jgi:flagellar export protein FliJ